MEMLLAISILTAISLENGGETAVKVHLLLIKMLKKPPEESFPYQTGILVEEKKESMRFE